MYLTETGGRTVNEIEPHFPVEGTQRHYKMQWTQMEIEEIPFKHKKILFYCQCNKTLEQPVQRRFVVSSPGDTQNPTGQSSEVLSSLRYFAALTHEKSQTTCFNIFSLFFAQEINQQQGTNHYSL